MRNVCNVPASRVPTTTIWRCNINPIRRSKPPAVVVGALLLQRRQRRRWVSGLLCRRTDCLEPRKMACNFVRAFARRSLRARVKWQPAATAAVEWAVQKPTERRRRRYVSRHDIPCETLMARFGCWIFLFRHQTERTVSFRSKLSLLIIRYYALDIARAT